MKRALSMLMRRIAPVILIVGLPCDPAAASPRAVPMIAAGSVVATPHPYDENADATAQLDAALAEARRTGRHVLLEFGANWCPDCRVLAGITGNPNVAPWFDANYVAVPIDIGRGTKNLDIARRYDLTISAVPTLLVLSAEGMPQNRDEMKLLSNARLMLPQDVITALARWCSPPPVTN
ncbi:MAG: thioredoxin family protein [Aliidongia sp.]